MLTRIITVTNPHAVGIHPKFIRRLAHVKDTLMPSLKAIGLEPEIFPAILRSSFQAVDGKVGYRGMTLTMGYGCTGNLLSNYDLWRLSAETNQPVFILEDDALIPPSNSVALQSALSEFLAGCGQNDALYLLSENPSVKDKLKVYHPSQTAAFGSHLSRLLRTEDLSCTAAYVVTPGAARVLMARLDQAPTLPTDGYLHTTFRAGEVGIIIQNDPTKGFMLNDNFAAWNH